VKAAFTSYLMVALAAGPWVCCCTTLRLAEFCSSFVRTSEQTPTQAERPSCCHTRATQGHGQEQRHDQGPSRPYCPCSAQRDGMGKIAVLDVRPAVSLPSFDGLLTLDIQPARPAVLPTERDLLPHESPPLPFCTSQDLLRAHHLLRC
jgi:hypothetical protein